MRLLEPHYYTSHAPDYVAPPGEGFTKAVIVVLVLSTIVSGALRAATFDETQTASNQQTYATDLQSWHALAEDGDVCAQYGLGATYARGRGVPLNYPAAVNWLRKAAAQGHVAAAYNLGVMYADGRGVRQDFAAAVSWYRKAADQGHAGAEASLGVVYTLGKSVPRDDGEALSWVPQGCRPTRCGSHVQSRRYLCRGARGSTRLGRGGEILSRGRRSGQRQRPIQSRGHVF
jgi:hypothetical protein